MPAITPETTRTNYKFKGHTVAVPGYFSTGQVLTENEARFAQRQLASVTGNILSSAIARKAKAATEANAKLPKTLPEGADPATTPLMRTNEDGTPYEYSEKDFAPDNVQNMYDAIYASYEIGVNNNRGDGAEAHDPVESIARNTAWELGVKPLLKAKGIKLNLVNAEKRAQLCGEYLDKFPSIRESAKAQFEAAQTNAGSTETALDNLLAGIGETAVTDGTDGANPPGTPDAPAPNADTPAEPEPVAA